MKLTIVADDNCVYVDGVSCFPLIWDGTPQYVRALQWDGASGWIEFSDFRPNEVISSLPAWANNAYLAWQNAIATRDQIKKPTVADNKITASNLLSQTDWANQLDVIDNTRTVYLTNQNDFLIFREKVRAILVNCVDGDIDWPLIPKAVWASQ